MIDIPPPSSTPAPQSLDEIELSEAVQNDRHARRTAKDAAATANPLHRAGDDSTMLNDGKGYNPDELRRRGLNSMGYADEDPDEIKADFEDFEHQFEGWRAPAAYLSTLSVTLTLPPPSPDAASQTSRTLSGLLGSSPLHSPD